MWDTIMRGSLRYFAKKESNKVSILITKAKGKKKRKINANRRGSICSWQMASITARSLLYPKLVSRWFASRGRKNMLRRSSEGNKKEIKRKLQIMSKMAIQAQIKRKCNPMKNSLLMKNRSSDRTKISGWSMNQEWKESKQARTLQLVSKDLHKTTHINSHSSNVQKQVSISHRSTPKVIEFWPS